MKVAHLLMVHKNPAQLERLLKVMDHENFDFFIHVDRKSDFEAFRYISDFPGVKFIKNRISCNWGGFSFVRGILNSLEEILDAGEEYSHINLMSAQDYPIKPVSEINHFFQNSRGKSFISYDTERHGKWWKQAMARIESFHLTDVSVRGKYILQRVLNTVLPKRKFPLPYTLYGGSDSSWWAITTGCARYVIDFMKAHPELSKFMQYTWGSDEFLFATLIMHSKHQCEVVNNNLRLITWEGGLPNPRILQMQDFELIKNASTKFFARKFDITVDSKILDKIDDAIR